MRQTPPATWSDRPQPDEYAPYHASLVGRVPEGALVALLEDQLPEVLDVLRSVDEIRAGHRYAPSKWSIRQVVGHFADTERIMAYRLLCVARGDTGTSLPGFDENAFVQGANFDERALDSLVEEWASARRSTIALLAGLDPSVSTRGGNANGQAVTARALACVMYGHVAHHVSVLQERYGVS